MDDKSPPAPTVEEAERVGDNYLPHDRKAAGFDPS